MGNRETLLQEITEVSFAMDDAKLFLDTHPDDAQALAYFQDCVNQRKAAMAKYAKEFEPLTIDCLADQPGCGCLPGTEEHHTNAGHFRWVDGPKPWGGECEHVGV